MSRRQDGVKDTPLSREYEARGLMRTGQVAHALGVDRELVRTMMRAGQIKDVQFDWSGVPQHGVPITEVDRIKAAMDTMRRT